MIDEVPVEEALRRQGWSVAIDGHNRRFEREGLTLSFYGHWSVRQYFISSLSGGWGDMQEIMSKAGLVPTGDDRDFLIAADHLNLIKSYLDSPEWEKNVRKIRHDKMERLREFQRTIGSHESWLPGEEDDARRKADWGRRLGGWNGLKYWVAAAISLAYIIYKCAILYGHFKNS